MKFVAIFSCVVCMWIGSADAETVTKPMKAAYESFKGLQVFLRDPSAFSDPQNDGIIRSQLQRLESSFHKIDTIDSKFKTEPGFVQTVDLVNAMLNDATMRFKSGKKEYSLWRMRTLSSHCITCHATYNSQLQFHDSADAPAAMSDLQRVDFYLSTRQFGKAKELLAAAIKNEQSSYRKMQLVRRWLVVETRSSGDLKGARSTLLVLLPHMKLPPSDLQEVEAWIASLAKWEAETRLPQDFAQSESMMRRAFSQDPLDRSVDPVAVLRASASLHALLARKSLTGDQRARALYLLGLGYNSLPLFFIDELPEVYLELCIEEFGGTTEARLAFDLYQDIVTARFSGSGGTNVPSDVVVRLMELYKKAHGIPEFEGKV